MGRTGASAWAQSEASSGVVTARGYPVGVKEEEQHVRAQTGGPEARSTPAGGDQPGADSTAERVVVAALTERQIQILAFEKQFFKYAGVKERAIHDQLGLTPIAYYQQVAALLDLEAAHAAEPALMARLRELRDQRGRRKPL